MIKPKISIIVTIYNIEKQLERCLDSLVNQTLKNIEIICVNDGSIDLSQNIIDKFHKKYPELIRPFFKKNGGGDWGARTYGLSKVKADYFCYVDGDDYVYPEYAEKLYKAIHDNSSDMAVCAMERVDIASGKTVSIDMNSFGNAVFNVNEDFGMFSLINPGPCNKAYRLSKIKNKKFHAIRGFSDLIFMLYSLPEVRKVSIIPDVLYSYQMRMDSQIHNIKPQDIETFKDEFLKLKNYYLNSKDRAKYIDILDLMAFIHLGVSLMYRISYGNDNLKNNIKDMMKFLDKNFNGWKTSKFLKINHILFKERKLLKIYIVSKVYKFRLYITFIKIYKFFIHKLKVDKKF